MREEFLSITSGWTTVGDFDVITEYIEATAKWAKVNGPLQPDEQATVELMIWAQIPRGMPDPDLIRMAGLEREYGIPTDDEDDGDI